MDLNFKMIFRPVIWSILAVTITGCEELFESTVEIEIPETLDRLVIVSNINTSLDSMSLQLTHSQNVLKDEGDFVDVNQASISIEVAGQDHTPNFQADGSAHTLMAPMLKTITDPGLEAILKVTHPGYPEITAKSVVPHPPQVSNFTYKLNATKDFDGYDLDELSFDIEDPSDMANYYAISAHGNRVDTVIVPTLYGDSIVVVRNTINVYLMGDGLTTDDGPFDQVLLSDAGFSGKTSRIRIGSYGFSYSGIKVISVIVKSISKDRYLFEKSLAAILFNDGNPFAEPANVHTNVTNGYGIFSVENEVAQKVEVTR